MNVPKPFAKRDKNRSEQSRAMISNVSSNVSVNNRIPSKSCINLEELMQFEAARQRALSQMAQNIQEKPLTEYVPHRVFINYVDTFNGSHIAEYLSNITRIPEKEALEGEGEFERLGEEFSEDNEEMFDDELDRVVEESLPKRNEEKKFDSKYEIIGSLEFLNNSKYSRPEGISELLDNENKTEFLKKLHSCGFIIYDITSDLYCHPKQINEAKWVLESIVKCLELKEKMQPKEFSKYTNCRIFILISTLLSWAKNKPIDPEDPSLPFTERDYRKRKPHPNYKVHCEFEKRVTELGKKYPNHLKTIVIGSGVTYGYEEDVLHFLFKMAWQGAPFLPVFKPGNNIIPVIHIDSLASVVHMIMENFPQKQKYLIATDPHSVTMKQMAKLLAKNLGNGITKTIDKEEAFLYPDIKQRNYDMLSVSINIVPGYIMDNMVVRWGSDLPFAENISQLILEYKTARGLWPVKIFIHGPPASGKTFMAKRLSTFYDVPHLYEKGIVEETISTLKKKIETLTEKNKKDEEKANQEKIEIEGDEGAEEEEEEEEADDDEDQENLETLKQTLKEIEDNMENNENNKLDDEYVIRFFKEKLSSNFCKNKGYVIDGYPESMEQTKLLYAPVEGEEEPAEDNDEEQGEDLSRLCNMNILPAYVESLDASDMFLINRVINLPETNFTPFEEHNMCRRLTEFRALNTEDNTPLIFYDEMEVHPMIYNIENDLDSNMEPTFQAIINHVGPPRNYGKEMNALEEILKAEAIAEEEVINLTKKKDEIKGIVEERRRNVENWMALKNQELEMEEKALHVIGLPLRSYLMKYIFPCLTRGLVEVARLRPDDPVDFLAEFLFRNNPEGKMFQPNYEEREEKLAQAVKEYEQTLAKKNTSSSKTSLMTRSTEKSPVSDAVSHVTNYKCSFVSSSKASTKSSKKSIEKRTSKASKASKASSASSAEPVCTCAKSPSLSTCSSDRTPSTPVSCTCGIPEPSDSCDSCIEEEKKIEDECKCPCV